MATWDVLARSPHREIVGVLAGYTLELTTRYNEVGSWKLTIPAEYTPEGWPNPGSGVVILREGKVFASGCWDEMQLTWDAENGGPGEYTLSGDTDLGRIAYRIVYPDPGATWESNGRPNGTVSHYKDSGQASVVMRRLVQRNASFDALPNRRVDGLQVASDETPHGANIRIDERFSLLLDALRSAAFEGGQLGFDIRDDLKGGLNFETWATVDRSRLAVFGVEAHNVASLEIRRTSPVATVALVAGPGEGTNRYMDERGGLSDALPAWGRRETFVDQRQISADQTDAEIRQEMLDAAIETIEDAGEQTAVNATVVDTPSVQFGREYGLGDLVTVLTPFGPVTDLVREVEISVSAEGVEDIRSTIGTKQAHSADPLADIVARLSKRVSQIERAQ